VNDLKLYLKYNGLDDKGKKDALINRVLEFIIGKQSI
jgi:hypothetical protein